MARSQGQDEVSRLQKEQDAKLAQLLKEHKDQLEKQQQEAADELARLKQVCVPSNISNFCLKS